MRLFAQQAAPSNNPGNVIGAFFEVRFLEHVTVNDLVLGPGIDLDAMNTGMNTPAPVWEYTVIEFLDEDYAPFSDVNAALSWTPGAPSQYSVAGAGNRGQAGIGNWVFALTNRVTGVGSASTSSSIGVPNDESISAAKVGLAPLERIGGFRLTTYLEDVRGTSNSAPAILGNSIRELLLPRNRI